ncbi:MAG: signal peptidase I [Terriglobales bacterium]
MAATGRTRRVLAAALTCVIPGSGQLWLGRKRTGLAFLFAFSLLILLYWPIRLPTFYAGVQVLILAAMVLCVVATWHSLRTQSQQATPGSRWWLLLLVPLALTASFGHSNWLLRASGFRLFEVPSTGMEPTVLKGDRVIADLKYYRDSEPRSSDVVVFVKDGTIFIKRVVGVGGDTLEGEHGVIVLNGQPLDEPYIQHIGNAPEELNDFLPTSIPPGNLFVMGDNRDVSRDSRMKDFGLVATTDVMGRALYIIGSNRARIGKSIR